MYASLLAMPILFSFQSPHAAQAEQWAQESELVKIPSTEELLQLIGKLKISDYLKKNDTLVSELAGKRLSPANIRLILKSVNKKCVAQLVSEKTHLHYRRVSINDAQMKRIYEALLAL